ncbi:MAG: hypothetical protein ACE5F9_05610 [Phycisphaerae bacterium]
MSTWRRFCVLSALIFLVRGMFVLSVLPPFEGWDEYQHLAYIAFLVEKGRDPVLKQSRVPRSLYPAIVAYPQARFAVDQVGGLGALSYEDFWKADAAPAVARDAPSLPLYQAQHAPFYYQLMTPVFRMLWNANSPLRLITALRLINILFGAAAVLVAGLAIGRLVLGPTRYMIVLLIALQPLFLMNCARVGSDALAVLLGTIVVAGIVRYIPRRTTLASIGLGVCRGLAILAKSSSLALLPFVLFVPASFAWHRRLAIRRAALAALLIVAAAGAVTLHRFRFNLAHYGVLTPMQEAVENHEHGRGFDDLVRAAVDVNWFKRLSHQYAWSSLWEGGWSYLKPPRFLSQAHRACVALTALGWCLAVHATYRRRRLFTEPGTAARLAVLGCGFAAGLAYHTVHGMVATGAKYTNVWYAAVSFPWLICLFVQSAAYLPSKWPRRILPAGLAIVYVATEIYGTLGVMVPEYTRHTWGAIARQRLGQLHLSGLGPELTLPALCLEMALLATAVCVWIANARPAPPAA